jgi:hypothetical protein
MSLVLQVSCTCQFTELFFLQEFKPDWLEGRWDTQHFHWSISSRFLKKTRCLGCQFPLWLSPHGGGWALSNMYFLYPSHLLNLRVLAVHWDRHKFFVIRMQHCMYRCWCIEKMICMWGNKGNSQTTFFLHAKALGYEKVEEVSIFTYTTFINILLAIIPTTYYYPRI